MVNCTAYGGVVTAVGWRAAMQRALYGEDGFFVRADEGPVDHFRTSVHASPLFAGAVLDLLRRVDGALGHPARLDVVDVGAGRGELLTTLAALLDSAPPSAPSSTPPSRPPSAPPPAAPSRPPSAAPSASAPPAPALSASAPPSRSPSAALSAPPETCSRAADLPLSRRARLVAVELAPRPAGLDRRIEWRREIPDQITGLLLATEWLDNVPVDVAEVDDLGRLRRVLVDPDTGAETLGPPPNAADRLWLTRWTDLRRPGERAEIGWPRDVAWADAVGAVRRGCALAVDYGHLRADRPMQGTLTAFRGGRQVRPIPDGTCDVTAHVAMDSAATAAGTAYALMTQRAALRALGVDGARPPLDLARSDPAGYLRALSGAGAAAELIDPAGLGGHWWLLHSIGIDHQLRPS